MRISTALLALTAIVPALAAPPAEADKGPGPIFTPKCGAKTHPCTFWEKNRKLDYCKQPYFDILKACAMTGCIQWFVDPVAECIKKNPKLKEEWVGPTWAGPGK